MSFCFVNLHTISLSIPINTNFNLFFKHKNIITLQMQIITSFRFRPNKVLSAFQGRQEDTCGLKFFIKTCRIVQKQLQVVSRWQLGFFHILQFRGVREFKKIHEKTTTATAMGTPGWEPR